MLLFLSLTTVSTVAQVQNKVELREERKLANQQQIDVLVNSKMFVFVARIALPQGFRNMDLTSNPNYIQFHPQTIKSEMPFFGRAFSAIGYGLDGGLNFEGTPEEFTIEKAKKSYLIKAVVKGEKDTCRMNLSVFRNGSATLSISSNNRSTISYNGEIKPLEAKESKL